MKAHFDDDWTSKANKSVLIKEVEGKLQYSDYNFNNQSDLSTAIMLDIMAQIRKQPTTTLKCFDDIFAAASNSVSSAEQIDIIYDSYLEDSIKECD